MQQISKNWSQIRLRVNVKASIEKVYRAVASQEGLESWFLRSAEFTSADGDARKRKDALSKTDRYAGTASPTIRTSKAPCSKRTARTNLFFLFP